MLEQVRFVVGDAAWEKVAPLLPGKASDPGVTARDNRLFLEAVAGADGRTLARPAGRFRPLEQRLDRLGPLGAALGHAADNAVVLDQFAHHLAGQHPLRAVRDMHVQLALAARQGQAQLGPGLGQAAGEALGGADRRGELEDDHVAGGEHGAMAAAAASMKLRSAERSGRTGWGRR